MISIIKTKTYNKLMNIERQKAEDLKPTKEELIEISEVF